MDRLLRPERLDLDPESSSAAREWNHWHRTFQNFILTTQASERDKFRLLINHVSPSIYDYISECGTFNDAINILKSLFVKPVNEVFARHRLASRKQTPGESITRYLESLRLLSKDCGFKAVTAETNRDDCIRDAFIAGILDSTIRQRLLENQQLTLNDAFTQARSLELAQHHSEFYQSPSLVNSVSEERSPSPKQSGSNEEVTAATSSTCIYCGRRQHPRVSCPAREAVCLFCSKKGHFQKVCLQRRKGITSCIHKSCLASLTSCLSKALVTVDVNELKAQALIDTGSSSSFISQKLSRLLKIPVIRGNGKEVSMANTSLKSSTKGDCIINLRLYGHSYNSVKVSVLPDLCADVIIGHDILGRHSSVNINFGGTQKPLDISALAVAEVDPAVLFPFLPSDIKPIAIKSRRQSYSNSKFIEQEIHQLLKEDIIEECISPWRAQVLVVSDNNHKRRMVIDYSQTINRYTPLDAFPLPRIDDILNRVASNNIFSTIDLKSAYHQIPIRTDDRRYTAFEACGKLFQFKRIPFGVTNGVAAFQRQMNKIIDGEKLEGTEAFLDDITIGGKNQAEHDSNLKRFLEAASKYNLTINYEKSKFSIPKIKFLGYVIENGNIKPDPDRLTPLRELPVPKDASSLKRALGMFSHYSNFIPKFSEKIQILTHSKFPLGAEAISTFNSFKSLIENAVVSSIDPEATFTVETDASERAIAATLSQNGRPVAFFSRTLSPSEQRHSSIEKEAHAIIEAVRKWRHYLMGRFFKLITDQKSVSFMFSSQGSGKVKNEKILRWRLELSCYNYEIIYRPGNQNEAADALSRYCSALTDPGLKKLTHLHSLLCHPGETRLYHYVRSQNMAYSLEEVRKVVSTCRICAEVKPRFFKHEGRLIKATQPFERLNVDFKGPLPSNSKNKYLLIIIDEFSRFPFAYPCPDLSASSIIKCLKNLFAVFGTPSFIHSDRGTSFMSGELKQYLDFCGVATSRTTPYNPRGNGQAERYVGTVWKTIELAAKSQSIDCRYWEQVLNDALNSLRSLLCTSTNTTPHERMFKHLRRSNHGSSTPTWLLTPGPVLMKRLVRQSKFEPLADEVTLLEGNSEYAHVRLPNGRETTISTRHLAPLEGTDTLEDSPNTNLQETTFQPSEERSHDLIPTPTREETMPVEPESPQIESPAQPLRRTERIRRRPAYLEDYTF